MPKAHEVAIELRKLADSLDREPDTDITQPTVLFNTGARKSEFLNVARLFPRPFIKQEAPYLSDKLEILYLTPGAEIKAWIERSAVCRLVRPAQEAEYECEPILTGWPNLRAVTESNVPGAEYYGRQWFHIPRDLRRLHIYIEGPLYPVSASRAEREVREGNWVLVDGGLAKKHLPNTLFYEMAHPYAATRRGEAERRAGIR